MNATQVFQLVATGLGVVGVISAAAVIMRSTVLSQNNSQLRNAYKDTRDVLQDKEKELAAKAAECEQLGQRVQMLESMVTGRDELAKLAEQVATLRAQEIASLVQHVGTLGKSITTLAEEWARRDDSDTDRGAAGRTAQPALRPPAPRRPDRGGGAGG